MDIFCAIYKKLVGTGMLKRINRIILNLIFRKKRIKIKHISYFMSNYIMELFGLMPGGEIVDSCELTNKNGMQLSVINYGATITDIITPDKDHHMASVILGFDSLKQYTGKMNALNGAVVGRVANRIANKRFTIDGKEYILSGNIHGGAKGFNFKF